MWSSWSLWLTETVSIQIWVLWLLLLLRLVSSSSAIVVMVALVSLGGVELCSVHSLDMFTQGRWVRVALCTSGSLASIGFLHGGGG